MTDKEKTIIELKEDEVALVMNSDENIRLFIPDMAEDDTVPEYVQFMVAISVICTSDQEVINMIWEKFNEVVDEEN